MQYRHCELVKQSGSASGFRIASQARNDGRYLQFAKQDIRRAA